PPPGTLPRMPPPPPERRRRRERPAGGILLSTKEKMDVASAAWHLRDEQVQAIVHYYGQDQRTNSELDAITEAVVAELQALRIAGEEARPTDVPDVEIELIGVLRELLEKLFSPKRRNFVERKIRDIQRRITQLFFDSELYARLAAEAGDVPAATWPEQALYYALERHRATIEAELRAMPVESARVRERALDRFHGFTRQLCTDFLSATTPELERLLEIYREVLADFFYEGLGQSLGELCWEVVRESRVAKGHRLGYKIHGDKFPAFRAAFDRHFLEKLVFHVQEPIVRRAGESREEFRAATLRFVSDPRIHSEICEVIDDAVYDYLHGEGFLDLPDDWRHVLQRH
ncbi:MAG TPA: hypothetical protein RMH99_03315, partial [Sandaracinaceae bacterium LLY-WYZ-13_1]|nr:hypothetical protein [Sandaracinaceae bacterium LLY-WYZ-13_1]